MMTGIKKRIFLVAGEPSGDQIGARLISDLRKIKPKNIEIAGVGGREMTAMGVSSNIDTKPLSIIGPMEVLKNYLAIKKIIRQTITKIKQFKPDTLVLIDSWGFTIRIAQQYRKMDPRCKIIKYIGPQVFASRPGRAKTTALAYDHLLTIHSFDAELFEKEGLPTTFVGNPVLAAPPKGNAQKFHDMYNPDQRPVLAVLFGSRSGEVRLLVDTFLDAIEQLKEKHPDLLVVSPLAENVATEMRAMAADDSRLQEIILLSATEKENLFKAADIALACSGTVTSELGQMSVPMVVGYRMGAISSFAMKHFVFKAKYACLLNLTVDARIVPEFLLDSCTARSLSDALDVLLTDERARALQQSRVQESLARMRGDMDDPSGYAAAKILELTD